MNIVGTINDLYEIIKSNVSDNNVNSTMVEVLQILEDNMIIDGEVSELNRCYGIDDELDNALDEYFSQKDDSDDELEIDY